MKKAPHDTADVVIVGGGAAGLMAAIQAKTPNNTVLLLEKNARCGEKLRITGGRRCNITNNTPDVRTLVSRYREAGKFLFTPFAQFGVSDTIDWFSHIGIDMKEEAEGRMFPTSESAVDVTDTLIAVAKKAGVMLRPKTVVSGIKKISKGFSLSLASGQCIEATKVIVATGGTSRPETGSSGDALPWLATLAHTIETPSAALVPVEVVELETTRRLGGVALKEVLVTLRHDGHVVAKLLGKVLFAHFGLTGPAILNLSQRIGEALATGGEVAIGIDLCPKKPIDVLERELLECIIAAPNKLVRNMVPNFVTSALAVPLLQQAGIAEHQICHSLTTPERKALVATMKAWRFTPVKLLGPERAVVSSGGVALPEIDFRTMESRHVPGLYIVGDVLNINRPTGGYSLQLAWTTGYIAGKAASGQMGNQEGR
jgi:predicted Rossmann fold flavoprotein